MAGTFHSNSDNQPWHVILTSADGIVIPLIAVGDGNRPIEFEGALTPADATEQFVPGGIPREYLTFDAGAGYTYFDERVPNGYDYSVNVWTMSPTPHPRGQLDEVSLPAGTHGEIRTAIQHNDDLYFSTGRYACKMVDSYSAPTVVVDFSTVAGHTIGTVITSACVYQGAGYWGGYSALGTAVPLVSQVFSSDTFTSGATCARWHVESYHGFNGAGDFAQWMIGTTTTNAGYKITNSTAPLLETNWTPGAADGTAVGDPSIGVQKIVASRQSVFMLKSEGIFTVHRGGIYTPNITPYWKDSWSEANGLAGAIMGGQLYVAAMGGVDLVRGLGGELNDVPYMVTPGTGLPTEMPTGSICYAICRDGEWIVAALYNVVTNDSYIGWGKPRESTPGQPGLTPMIWHCWPVLLTDLRVTWMRKVAPTGSAAITAGAPFLLIATRNPANTETKLWRLSLPLSGNPIQDMATGGPWRATTTTCTLYLSRYPGAQGMHSEKAIRHVATVSKNCSTTPTTTLKNYIAADDGTRVQVGSTVTTSPYQEHRITTSVAGRMMAPSVDFTAGSATAPPILRGVTYWTAEGVTANRAYRGRFRFAQGMKLRNGALASALDPAQFWDYLLAAQGPRPATLTDWKGTTYTVAFEQGCAWKERELDGGDHYEIDFTIQFTVLATTA